MTIIIAFEALGLAACLLTFSIAARSTRMSGGIRRSTLLALVVLLGLGHLANLLEAAGHTWADILADQFSIMVPFLWGLFLLETGRGYLSARLAASDEQLRFFLEAVPSSVAWLDGDGKLLGFSQAWATTLPESAPGRRLQDVLPLPLPLLLQSVASGGSSGVVGHERLVSETASAPDGRQRHFRWCLRSWSHPDRPSPGVMVLLEEATAEVEADEQRAAAADELVRTQRMAHVGQMAAGAAHDFNNFLQVIHGALWELEPDARHHQALANVQRALDSAREMTRSMLRFGHEHASSKTELVDLALLLRDIRSPLSFALGRRHRLELELPESGSVRIEGRSLRLQQAVLNLAINARDAMPHGGVIEIVLTVEAGSALLSVRDSGSGMSEDVKSRLFTPFFTTKGAQGSGLGLHVVQSVVQEQRGEISVQSEPEHGSTFLLRLPLAARAEAS